MSGTFVIERKGGNYKGVEIGMTKIETIRAIKSTVIQTTMYASGPSHMPSDLQCLSIDYLGRRSFEKVGIAMDVPEEDWDTQYAPAMNSDWWSWTSYNFRSGATLKVDVHFENGVLTRITKRRHYLDF